MIRKILHVSIHHCLFVILQHLEKLLSKNVHIFTKSYQIIKIKGVDINAHDVIKTVCGEVLIIVDDKTKSNCNETGYNQTKKIMSVAILKKVYFIKIPRVFCSNQFNFN